MHHLVTSNLNLTEDHLDRVFHALGDRTRRAIVGRLLSGPATVKELAAPFPVTLPAIGKHLRVLEAAGIMDRKIRGRTHVCSLSPDALSDANTWLQRYRSFWEENLESLAHEAEHEHGA